MILNMLAKKKEKLVLYIYTIILLAINSVRIFNDSIWGDEGFSIMLATSDISYLIDRTARDVHPPLYYLLLKGFYNVFGATAAMGKLLSFLAIAVICLLAVTYFCKKFGAAASMILIGVVTFTGNCVSMIVEIRMYSWAMLFLILTLIFIIELLYHSEAYSILKKVLCWAGLSVSSLLAAYTHYYALITVAILDAVFFILIFLSDHKTWKYICGSLFVMIAGYLPWLSVLIKTFQGVLGDYWIAEIDIKRYLAYIFGDDIFGYLLLLVLVVSVLLFGITENGIVTEKEKKDKSRLVRLQWKYGLDWKNKDKQLVFLCLAAGFGTIVVGVIVSYVFRPLYVDRYIYPAIGLLAVALAVSFVKTFRDKALLLLLLVLMGCSGIHNFSSVCRTEATYMTEETKEYLLDNLEAGDAILTDNTLLAWTVIRYYFPDYQIYDTAYCDLTNMKEERIWFMLEGQEDTLDTLVSSGYHVEKVMETGLDNVFFTLYLLTK